MICISKHHKIICRTLIATVFFLAAGCKNAANQTGSDTAAVSSPSDSEGSVSKADTTKNSVAPSSDTEAAKPLEDSDTQPYPKKKYVFGSEIDKDEPCDHCEQRFCTKINGENFIEQCKKGKNAALCEQVVECAAKTNCAAEKSADCYCGMGSDIGKCMVEGGDGPCKEIIEKASESKKPNEIAARFGNPAYVIGRAVAWIDCKTRYCPKCNEPK